MRPFVPAILLILTLTGCHSPNTNSSGGSGGSSSGGSYPGQKWEYKVANIRDEVFSMEMDRLGDQGWEAVSARRATALPELGTDFGYEIIFKRPKVDGYSDPVAAPPAAPVAKPAAEAPVAPAAPSPPAQAFSMPTKAGGGQPPNLEPFRPR